jgi:hypothetical protein
MYNKSPKFKRRLNKKIKRILSLFDSCTTQTQLAEKLHISRQAIYQLLVNYGIYDAWCERMVKLRPTRDLPSTPAVVKIYFVDEPKFAYYGLTQNYKRYITTILSILHYSQRHWTLQTFYNKYGPQSIRYQMVDDSYNIMLLKSLIKNNKYSLNRSLPMSKEEFAYRQQVNTRRQYLKRKSLPFHKSPYKCIMWSRMNQKWRVVVRQTYLGTFTEITEAKAARDKYTSDNNIILRDTI